MTTWVRAGREVLALFRSDSRKETYVAVFLVTLFGVAFYVDYVVTQRRQQTEVGG